MTQSVWFSVDARVLLFGALTDQKIAPATAFKRRRRSFYSVIGYEFFGANIMIAIPINATEPPIISHTVGFTPSTDQSHNIATKIYTPP